MLSIIAARSENNVIGKDGKIPWHIEGEQEQFRQLTMGKTVIMGRKTYEEIGRPLPGRKTIVVSGTGCFEGEGLLTAASFKEALDMAGSGDVFVAGGYSLYKEAIPLADVMYITEVKTVVEDGDVFFPRFNADDFDLSIGETKGKDLEYTRTVYTRKRKEDA